MARQPGPLPHHDFKAPIPASDGYISEAVYWVPNELAVTVQAPALPTLDQLRDLSHRLKRLLSEVGISVVPFYAGGQRLSRAGAKPASPKPEGEPSGKQEYVEVEIEVGRTKTTARVEVELEEQWQVECKRRPHRFPGVHFFGSDAKSAATVFYTLLTHHRRRDERRDSVQIAVDYINQNLQKLGSGDNSLRVLAAMPNWLTYDLQMGGTPTSGPGAPPLWSTFAASGTWTFKQPQFAKLIQENAAKGSGAVKVILLDTASSKDEIIARAQAIKNDADLAGRPENGLLEQIVHDLQTGKMLITDHYAATLLKDHFFAGQDDLGRPFAYNMNDHGLFIAGIIRSIAPQAEIKLVRTQNSYGAGDMNVFLDALDEVAQRQDTHQIVLNLSMGTLPPLEELHQIWFGSTCCCETPAFFDALNTLEKLDLALKIAIRSLVEKGVVVVAAAGNDSLGKNPPHGPRYPARYEQVLGVAAVNRKGEAAAYSNRANADYWGSGIATYGGEEPDEASEILAEQSGVPDAPRSLYLNNTYPPLSADDPPPPDPNMSGWAWWSGTSFATAVASGLAAQYVMSGLHGQDVIKAIHNGLASAPYCGALQARVLEVVEN